MNRGTCPYVRNRARGITLIELLVVIAIAGILVSLLLAGVQHARESARRMTCENKMRQLGVAVHAHSGAMRRFPISVGPFFEGPAPTPRRDGRGWIVGILPYMEQPALWQRISVHFDEDFLSGQGMQHPNLRSVVQTRLSDLQCPSDSSVRNLSDKQYQWFGIPVALTSYKGVIGDNRMGGSLSMFDGTLPDCIHTGNCNGVFHRLSYQMPVTMAEITDGTSNTFLIGEDVPEANSHSVAFYANGDYASCHAPLNYFPDPPRPLDWWDVMSFRSRHPHGASFCFVDGSVQFVNDAIDYKAYRALSTKNGMESVVFP